jgi:hypothetical protein
MNEMKTNEEDRLKNKNIYLKKKLSLRAKNVLLESNDIEENCNQKDQSFF